MNITVTAPTINTVLAIAAIVTAAILLFAFIKRLISLIAITLCMLIMYAGYLYFSGQRIPLTKKEILVHGIEQMNKIKTEGGIDIDSILKEPKKER